MKAPLRAHFKDLPTSEMKEILLQRMLEENYDKGHEDHRMAYDALQKSILRDESEQFDADKAEECKKMKSKQDSPKTLPESPPPLPSGASGASGTTGAIDFAQDPLPPPQSSTTNPDDQSPGSTAPGSSKTAAITAYTAWTTTTSRFEPSALSIPEDDWFKPLSEDERPATPEPDWSIPSSSLPVPIHNWASALASSYQGITELTPEHLEGPAYEVVKSFHPDVIHLQFQMEECHKLLTNQVNDRLLSKGDRLALSITKMKAAYYPDVGLEQMRQKFYIDRHSAETNRRAIVRTHMRILSVVRIEVFSIYGSPEPPTAKGQEDSLYCYQLMDHESSYQTTGRRLPTGLEFMHDYKILDSLLAVVFKEKYGMQMIMYFNEIHKFSDGTLQQIDEALDYRVKEFRVNKVNPGLNTSFRTTNDVIKSKQFMFAIQKRLKLRRIFRNMESFVGGRILEGDYRLLQRTE
ncbi:hypothetical protein Tco_1415168 [Tanacetum coccineum]